MRKWAYILAALIISACSPIKHLDGGQTLYTGIKKIEWAAPDSLDAVEQQAMGATRSEVEAVLAYAPTGALFGSSSIHLPSSPGVMFYNLFADSKKRFGRWMFSSFAKAPVTLTDANPRTRVLVARNTLHNYGYLRGKVDYEILRDKKPQRAHVGYAVYPGELFRLDSVEYRGFPPLMDSLLRATLPQSLLQRDAPFTVPALDGERSRISTLMRNRGFYNFAPDVISYQADTIQRPGHVQLRVQPSAGLGDETLRRYYIGRTDITMLANGDLNIVDSLPNGRFTPKEGRKRLGGTLPRLHLKMRYSGTKGKSPLRLSAMRKYLFYREGMPYHHDIMEKVGQQLSGMGVFSHVQMMLTPQTSDPGCDTLMVKIVTMLDKPYDSEFEARVMSKSNGQVGPGASYSLSKRNALRRAEKVTWKVRGSYEWQTGSRPEDATAAVINSYELGTSLQMDFPRLVLPGTRAFNRQYTGTTTFKLDASWLHRAGYFAMVEFSGEATYTMQRTLLSKHTLTPFKLKYSTLLSTTAQFDDVASRNQALFVSMRDQLVPSMEYTYALTSSKRTRHPGALTVTVKEAGNLLSGIYAMGGRRFKTIDKKLLGVPFAQYIKLTADMRKEVRLTQRQSIVGHLAAGAVWTYGNSRVAPYSDLFAVGGANSIRAFCLRGIGPGRYNPRGSGYSYLDQMGDLKLEANLEYRFPVLPSLYGAAFIDCGNVWLMRPDSDRPGGAIDARHFARDLALGTGVGVRYDLEFLVIRFDLGIGIHAPYDTGREGYYNMPHFGRSLGYHFAIGYPF